MVRIVEDFGVETNRVRKSANGDNERQSVTLNFVFELRPDNAKSAWRRPWDHATEALQHAHWEDDTMGRGEQGRGNEAMCECGA